MKQDWEQLKIIFYDGDCGFCNRSVQFVLNHERGELIHFCALQSEIARDFFDRNRLQKPDLSTFYFWDGKLYQKSGGAIRVLKYLKGAWPLLRFFWIVPAPLRNWVYDQIAKRRHRISAGFCMLPTVEQQKRFLR